MSDPDFSDKKFKSRLPGPLPQGIQRMLERALESFGTDRFVREQRWTRALPNGKLESEFFGFTENLPDICCGDTAGFVTYQSGACDFVNTKNSDKRIWYDAYGTFSWAPHWLPYPDSEMLADEPKYGYKQRTEDRRALLRLVQSGRTLTEFIDDKGKLVGRWLPGDYLLYSVDEQEREHPPGQPAHINVFLGDFQEVDASGAFKTDTPVYQLLNGSIGLNGRNNYVTAQTLKNHLTYWIGRGAMIRHCRVIGLEQLFDDAVGVPLRAARPGDPTASAEPPIENFWADARDAGAPYPIGRNRTWHEGIHLRTGAHVQGRQVVAFAPGEIVLARLAKATSPHGDTSFLLLRHRFDRTRRTLLPKELVSSPGPGTVDSALVYSLYMHLAPLPTYLDDAGRPRGGDGDEAACPPWIRKLALEPVPERRRFVRAGTAVTMVTWTRDADGNPARLVLPSPRKLVAMGDRDDWNQFEAIQVDGKSHRILPVVHQPRNEKALDVSAARGPTSPSGAKLHYYNPLSGEVFATQVSVATTTPLGLRDGGSLAIVQDDAGAEVPTADGKSLVRIELPDDVGPGVQLPLQSAYDVHPKTTPDDAEDEAVQAAIAALGGERKHVLEVSAKKLPVFRVTRGSDKGRWFPDDTRVELSSSGDRILVFATERATTGGQVKRDRIWLDLVPCVGLTADQRSAAERSASEAAGDPRRQAKQRLEARESCLLGIQIREKDGWSAEDGLVRPTAERLAQDPKTRPALWLFPLVAGAGSDRYFPDPRPGAGPTGDQAVDSDVPLVHFVDPSDSVKILPADGPFQSLGKQRALVEVQFCVPEDSLANNDAEIERVKEENRARERALTKLRKGEVVDLSADEDFPATARIVDREHIGAAGEISADDASTGSRPRGLHFEIFSGENLVDKGVAGSAGKLTPVPKGTWQVLRDEAEDDLTTPASFQRVLEQIMKLPGIDGRGLGDGSLPKDALDAKLPTAREWLQFCAANDRLLARVISVHPPEWKVDWDTLVDQPNSRFSAMPGSTRERLKEALRDLRWWPDDLALEGISGSTAVFFHPLRFIEWLSTGLDVGVSGTESAKVTVETDRTSGKESVPLERSKETKGYHYRTTIEGAHPSIPATLVIDGLSSKTWRFPVSLLRGNVRQIHVVKPEVRLQAERDQPGLRFAIPVTQLRVETGDDYLLADGNAELAGSGYARASFLLVCSYNLERPTKLSVQLSGAGARISWWDLPGAKTTTGTSSGAGSGGALEIELPPDRVPEVEAPRSVVARIHVVAERTFGAEVRVVARASGGDFEGGQESAPEIVRTREIRRKVSGATKGEDVAKLQLYLSQILDDALPCYLHGGKAGDFGGDKAKAVLIDGDYGQNLARGIWRFVYAFCAAPDWQAATIGTTDGKGNQGPGVARSEITSPTGSPDRFEERRALRCGPTPTEFPVVDAPLLAEIVKRFRIPNVLPQVGVEVDATALGGGAPAFAVAVNDRWNGTLIGRSTILPVRDKVRLKVTCPELEHLDGDVQIRLELPQEAAYRFAGGASAIERGLRAAVAESFALVPSGNVTTSETANALVVSTIESGRTLGRFILGGARDLAKKQGDSCRDAALLQFYLSQVKEPGDGQGSCLAPAITVKGKVSVPKPTIDGQWGGGSLAAFERFVDANVMPGVDYASTVAEVISEYGGSITE